MQALFPGKLNPAHNAKWTRLGVLPPITVSDTFACAFQGQKMKARVALVLLPPANDIIVVHFNYPESDSKARAVYEKASESMLQSIELMK